MRFGVLGAGIVGLNTALELQNQFPTEQITIIADKFGEETLSHGAAGIFRPGESFLGPSKEITRSWIIDSYNYYNDILRSSEADNAGIMEVSGYIFSSKYPSLTRNHFLENLLPMYRVAEEDELQLCPGDWKFGTFMTTMVIESGRFLPWAMKKFEGGGGKVLQRRLDSFQDLHSFEPFDALVNCTGFGSKWLCQDTKLVPLRGQVFKVRAPWIKMFYYGDLDTYIIPGRDAVTLGGCRQYESYDESVSVHDSAAIWKRCTSLVPSLKKAAVAREWVGLRPYRHMVKCNFEHLRINDKDTKIIHLYGHGGYGVTSAPGSAKYAVQLLTETLKGKGDPTPKNENKFLSKL